MFFHIGVLLCMINLQNHCFIDVFCFQAMATGEIEVLVEKIDIVNKAKKMPFEIREFTKVTSLPHLANLSRKYIVYC